MYFADENLLYNPRLRRAYRIEDGVPMMLAERAEPVPEQEHERLITRARDGAADMSGVGLASGGPNGH
ncbi:MAG: Trm112 family protein [Trebonia sp.]